MNLFEHVPDFLTEEFVEIIFSRPHCRVERIISRGQTTPENTWYDQPEEEWVVLLQGAATLSVERDRAAFTAETGSGEADPVGAGNGNPPENDDGAAFEEVHLKKGDSFLIKMHQKHRVTYTSEDPPCIWLCFYMLPT